LNAKDASSGKTPLFYVTESRISSTVQIQMIQALVGAGADPNIRDALGRTPIFAAGKSSEVIEALSKAGADLKIKDNEAVSSLVRRLSKTAMKP
jgi:ankyrin repeat protein